MSGQTVVEIKGPSAANLYRIFEEESSDLLLKMFGSKSVLESTETTDQSAQNCTRKVTFIPDSWKVVDITQVLDWTTGDVDVTDSTEDDKCCLGFLRLRKSPSDPEAFSYHDQLVLKGLEKKKQQYLFLLASREVGANTGIKYKMTGKMNSSSTEDPAQVQVQIVTPSIEKIKYRQATDRQGSAVDSMMRGVKIEGLDEVISSLGENVEEQFLDRAATLSRNIISLEEPYINYMDSIRKLKRKIAEAAEKTAKLKKIRGIQSNLETALEYAITDY